GFGEEIFWAGIFAAPPVAGRLGRRVCRFFWSPVFCEYCRPCRARAPAICRFSRLGLPAANSVAPQFSLFWVFWLWFRCECFLIREDRGWAQNRRYIPWQ